MGFRPSCAVRYPWLSECGSVWRPELPHPIERKGLLGALWVRGLCSEGPSGTAGIDDDDMKEMIPLPSSFSHEDGVRTPQGPLDTDPQGVKGKPTFFPTSAAHSLPSRARTKCC